MTNQSIDKEMVIYKNDLNRIPLKGFDSTELKLFFAIIAKVKYRKSDVVEISDDYIENVVDKKQHLTKKAIEKKYNSMLDKLYNVSAEWGDPNGIHGKSHVFSTLVRDENKKVSYLHVEPPFVVFFNELDKEFTRFELGEYLSLPGIYPKQLYRLLKQWRMVGHYAEDLDEFRTLIDAPESYKTKDITRRIIEPSVKSLKKLSAFKELSYKYSYRGHKAVGIEFNWKPETVKKEIDNKAKEKAIKNMLGNDTEHSQEEIDKWKKYITFEN